MAQLIERGVHITTNSDTASTGTQRLIDTGRPAVGRFGGSAPHCKVGCAAGEDLLQTRALRVILDTWHWTHGIGHKIPSRRDDVSTFALIQCACMSVWWIAVPYPAFVQDSWECGCTGVFGEEMKEWEAGI